MAPVSAETPPPATTPPASEAKGAYPWLLRWQQGLDRLLVLDVFLVLAGALWFGIGVALHLRGMDAALTAFQRLWPSLFQPAIGVLMLGALVSGGLGWWRRRGPL
ncbi:MAG: hypothetical protein ACKOOC_00420 [Cyanobium sp.]